jgi:hypothetical protein
MSHNTEMAHAMEILRRNCAEIAFIPATTDIGLDDDLEEWCLKGTLR